MAQTKKKKSPVILIYVFLLSILFSIFEAPLWLTGGLILLTGGLILLLVIITLFKAAFTKPQKPQKAHTHDRNFRQQDLKINPATGKADNRPLPTAHQHDARSHWQQQLDDLLANGTIDRAEYKAMMDRHF